jgi:hypothetical protein
MIIEAYYSHALCVVWAGSFSLLCMLNHHFQMAGGTQQKYTKYKSYKRKGPGGSTKKHIQNLEQTTWECTSTPCGCKIPKGQAWEAAVFQILCNAILV